MYMCSMVNVFHRRDSLSFFHSSHNTICISYFHTSTTVNFFCVAFLLSVYTVTDDRRNATQKALEFLCLDS